MRTLASAHSRLCSIHDVPLVRVAAAQGGLFAERAPGGDDDAAEDLAMARHLTAVITQTPLVARLVRVDGLPSYLHPPPSPLLVNSFCCYGFVHPMNPCRLLECFRSGRISFRLWFLL